MNAASLLQMLRMVAGLLRAAQRANSIREYRPVVERFVKARDDFINDNSTHARILGAWASVEKDAQDIDAWIRESEQQMRKKEAPASAKKMMYILRNDKD